MNKPYTEVHFYLSRDTKMPVRGTNQAAGIDFFIPYYNEEFLKDFREKNASANLIYEVVDGKDRKVLNITIPPHERINIPSGVHSYLEPKESALIAANKSGVSTKKGLVFTCQVIDSDYTGEIHLGLVNTSNSPVTVSTGDKIVQFIHTPVFFSFIKSVDTKEEFYAMHEGTQRGDNAFGSTGEK
jgi:dUTP pyrophosphatase